MSIDILATGVGVLCFCIFFLIHLITFRKLRPEELLRSLSWCVAAVIALPVIATVMAYKVHPGNVSIGGWILAAILALLITGLLSLGYILCIFGPYETSVRMRLVREISGAGPAGMTMQELLGNYSPETILKIRLRRLLGSGDIVDKDGIYHCGRTENFFFMFDIIANLIKKWIGR